MKYIPLAFYIISGIMIVIGGFGETAIIVGVVTFALDTHFKNQKAILAELRRLK